MNTQQFCIVLLLSVLFQAVLLETQTTRMTPNLVMRRLQLPCARISPTAPEAALEIAEALEILLCCSHLTEKIKSALADR